MRNKLFVTLGILGISLLAYAGPKHSQETSYPSYKGLIMAGYQGWFRGPQDGTNQGYGHYGTGKQFDEKHCTIQACRWKKGTCIQFSGQVYCRPALQMDEGVWSGWSIRATFF